MNTLIVERYDIDHVVKCLKNGGVVAFPTDTVYGIGVIYDDMEALKKLKLSKGRPESKPIPMMVSSVDQIKEVAYTNDKIERLIEKFMPGGFTIVLKKRDCIQDEVTNGFDTIAIRMPEDDFVLEMISMLNKPMLVTSANLSGMPTGVNSEEVVRDFNGRIDAIVLGECKQGVSSTIVDVSGDEVKILREGLISKEGILKIYD